MRPARPGLPVPAAVDTVSPPSRVHAHRRYNEDCTLDEALMLAVKVFAKTLDSTTLTSEKLEFGTLKLVDGKPTFGVIPAERVSELLAEGKKIKDEEEAAEKAKKEAQTRKRKPVEEKK